MLLVYQSFCCYVTHQSNSFIVRKIVEVYSKLRDVFIHRLTYSGHRAALVDASNTTFHVQSHVGKSGAQVAEMPNFHTELRSMEVFDGQHVHLEAKISPANDPKLKITWLFNGKSLNSSKFLPFRRALHCQIFHSNVIFRK